MDPFIKFCERILPKLGADKRVNWFADYKYSNVYLLNDNIIANIDLQYVSDSESYYDQNERHLLRLSGAKAYKKVDDEDEDYYDIKQTAKRYGLSKYDDTVTTSKRCHLAFCYLNILVVVSAPLVTVTKIAHKVLMNIVVSNPYKHENLNALEMIERDESSHLINPVVCECCDKPSQTILKNLKICSGCMSARYCDRECQKKDWKNHKCDCKNTVA